MTALDSAKRIQVFQTRTRIKQHHAFIAADLAVCEQGSEGRQGCGALRRGEYAFGLSNFPYRAQQLLVGHRNRSAATLAEYVEHYEIANGPGHSQARGNGLRILDINTGSCTGMECSYDRGAPLCLDRDHSGPPAVDPTHPLHLVKGFPHADQSCASAGWI